MKPELPSTYYLDNFCHLLGQVRNLYADILSTDELSFCDDFFALAPSAQCLYVRLLGRRGDWFRLSRIQYSEVADPETAATILQANRFASIVPLDSPEAADTASQWLPLFTRPELLGVLNDSSARSLKKEPLVELVAQRLQDGRLELPDESLLCVFGEREMEVMRLLYFGNLHQDLTEFVLRDLGIYQYHPYPLTQSTRWCRSREQLLRHLALSQLWPEDRSLADLSVDELVALVAALPDDRDDPLLQRRCDRLRNTVARQLERLGAVDEALSVYAQSATHPARERTLRLLVEKQSPQAATLAAAMVHAPWSEEEQQFLQSFVPRRLKEATALAVALSESAHRPLADTLILPSDIQRIELGVERATCEALQRQHPGDSFVYCENLLIPGVFGLLFWDVIFAPVEGAFFHPFQSRPADLYEPEFMSRRGPLADSVWTQLQDHEAFTAQVLDAFHRHHGMTNVFVHWGFLTEELLQQALQYIPTAHWQACFEFMLRDLRNHRAGLPDLIRFSTDGRYELLEVKGPGDTLQKNQKAWLRQFDLAGIPARVLLVRDA